MPRNPPPDNILDYAPPPARISLLARFAFWLSLLSIFTFFFVLPGLIALTLAVIADERIKKHPDKLAGRIYSYPASVISICTFLLGVACMLLPTMDHPPELRNRSQCAANLRGIMNSMVIYAAQNNGHYPTITYAPYSAALNSPTAPPHTYANTTDTVNAYYRTPYPQAGSVAANLWLLVLEDMSPKLFICRSDTHTTGPADLVDSAGRYYDNFQNDKQLSYSFAYPWKADGTVGKWWSDTSDASIPIATDMAPQQSTGIPVRILNPSSKPTDPKTWLSDNHAGDGQNVAFGDVHVDWVKSLSE